MRGAFWMSPKLTTDDLYGRRVAVYRNTTPLKNRARQRDYIWTVEDCETGKVLAIATEVPLVGEPVAFAAGGNPAVLGCIPPAQLILSNARSVTLADWGHYQTGAVIMTSDGECWAA